MKKAIRTIEVTVNDKLEIVQCTITVSGDKCTVYDVALDTDKFIKTKLNKFYPFKNVYIHFDDKHRNPDLTAIFYISDGKKYVEFFNENNGRFRSVICHDDETRKEYVKLLQKFMPKVSYIELSFTNR